MNENAKALVAVREAQLADARARFQVGDVELRLAELEYGIAVLQLGYLGQSALVTRLVALLEKRGL